jgi:methylated-DNA-[protein]-cysteine S-methyltransferase
MMKTCTCTDGLDASCWLSPVGWFTVIAGRDGVREISCDSGNNTPHLRVHGTARLLPGGPESAEAMAQIREYFEGKRRTFSLRLSFDRFSPFTADVLKQLSAIPFGKTVTYGELAAAAGRPGAARAVGRAMAVNPFILVIPCHRVLGVGGKMIGYSGGSGITTKEWLLGFERDQERVSAEPAKIRLMS